MVRPKNPEFEISSKEYALLEQVARRNKMATAAFAKKVILDRCKEEYLAFKKQKQEKEFDKQVAKEIETDVLIKEIVDSGDLEYRKKIAETYHGGGSEKADEIAAEDRRKKEEAEAEFEPFTEEELNN